MEIPSATYRIQFHKEFTFDHLRRIAPYLHELGISTVYASPVTTATPGSQHGYDVTDPDTVNSEIGTIETWKKLTTLLKKKNIWWLQDIVPNHMAYATGNTRLADVMERGNQSEYFSYFDINWKHPAPDLHGKLMAPFLGDELHTVIEKGDIRLAFGQNGFTLNVYDGQYPLSVPAYDYVASHLKPGEQAGPLQESLRNIAGIAISGIGMREWQLRRHEWLQKLLEQTGMPEMINEAAEAINNDKNKLLELLQLQSYTLTNWRRTKQEINYRRFFTVNSLICLQMEDENVFSDYHRLLHTAWKEGIIKGLRIDHIDGLYDPTRYIEQLRRLFGEDCYIIAEKILETKENLPPAWNLQGTSGYEFLSYISQLLTNIKGATQLLQFYRQLLPSAPSYDELVLQNKTLILEQYMGGEWDNLVRYFIQLNLQHNYDHEKIKNALGAVMVAMPVYRIYADQFPLEGESLTLMKTAFETARRLQPESKPELFYLESVLLNPGLDGELNTRSLLFLRRMMQFTGPLMAKGVEDTTFYVYNAHIVHNEVGDDPSVIGISIEAFHEAMRQRQLNNPLCLNATATHDTKRGEDARLRINVLSELSDEWQQKIRQWLDMNTPLRSTIKEQQAPSLNDEYFIYQSIVGGMPPDIKPSEEWLKRFEGYMIKVLRESKVNSNWDDPDEEYEHACLQFIRSLFDRRHGFLADFKPFMEKVSIYAGIYSLAQVLIKLTAPGIPDIYQGCELWDLSFVDPDNRRPINYGIRKKMLKQLLEKEKEGMSELLGFAKNRWRDGYEKLLLTWKILQFRKNNIELFTRGDYLPLEVTGTNTEAIAFARHLNGRYVIAVTPLGIADKYTDRSAMKEWDNHISLPEAFPENWKNIITGEVYQVAGKLSLQKLFNQFPIALLSNE